jgi:hypothetical protein
MDDIRAGWNVEALIESRLLNLSPRRAGQGRRRSFRPRGSHA